MYKCSKPLSYREPVLDPLWQQIMVEKLYALPNTDTSDVVLLSPSKRTIGFR